MLSILKVIVIILILTKSNCNCNHYNNIIYFQEVANWNCNDYFW